MLLGFTIVVGQIQTKEKAKIRYNFAEERGGENECKKIAF